MVVANDVPLLLLLLFPSLLIGFLEQSTITKAPTAATRTTTTVIIMMMMLLTKEKEEEGLEVVMSRQGRGQQQSRRGACPR